MSAPTTRSRRPQSNGDGLILNTMGIARGPVISYRTAALISLIIGTAIGLGIGWVLSPVEFTNADPADLRSSYKDDYIRMISAAFQLDGNVSRATLRLSQLGLGTPSQAVNDLLGRESKEAKNAKMTAALADFARALNLPSSVRPPATPIASAARVTVAAPTAAPTEILAAYRLVEHTPLTCSDEPDQAYLRFFVRDSNGRDVPNVGIQVSWENGEDLIYTGLKPERGLGYADLLVAPNTYSASILDMQAESASGMQIGDSANCKTDRGTPRGWKIVFQKQ